MSTIAENVASIREKMAEAAKQAGRDPDDIRLCAATKMNDAAAVREAIAAGVDCCGENRVQSVRRARMRVGPFTSSATCKRTRSSTLSASSISSSRSTGWSFSSASKSRRRKSASHRTFCSRSILETRRANPALHPRKLPSLQQKWENIPTSGSTDSWQFLP